MSERIIETPYTTRISQAVEVLPSEREYEEHELSRASVETMHGSSATDLLERLDEGMQEIDGRAENITVAINRESETLDVGILEAEQHIAELQADIVRMRESRESIATHGEQERERITQLKVQLHDLVEPLHELESAEREAWEKYQELVHDMEIIQAELEALSVAVDEIESHRELAIQEYESLMRETTAIEVERATVHADISHQQNSDTYGRPVISDGQKVKLQRLESRHRINTQAIVTNKELLNRINSALKEKVEERGVCLNRHGIAEAHRNQFEAQTITPLQAEIYQRSMQIQSITELISSGYRSKEEVTNHGQDAEDVTQPESGESEREKIHIPVIEVNTRTAVQGLAGAIGHKR